VPPVGDCSFQVVVDIPYPGAPLPDIVVQANLGGVSGYTLESASFRGTASGPTPSGQAAQLVISQTGVVNRTPNLIRDFGFTTEVVSVKINQGSAAPAATPQATIASAASTSPATSPPAATTAASTSPATSPPAATTAAVDAVFGNVLNTDPLASGL
jgi:hypothetical protein